MNIQVTSDNIEISPSMHALAKEKISRLESRFSDTNKETAVVRVVLNKGHEDTFEAKVELSFGKMQFVGESQNFALETALIEAVEDVERQYRKEKSKRDTTGWEEAREMKRFNEEETE